MEAGEGLDVAGYGGLAPVTDGPSRTVQGYIARMSQPAFRALVLPADEPPRRSSLKRQLLFFDGIVLIHPDDRALVNDQEITETFPGGVKFGWSSRAPFPRSEHYAEAMLDILDETRDLQAQGKIKVLKPQDSVRRVDPGVHWTAYMTAISNADLLQAAIPDCGSSKVPIQLPNGVYSGLELAPHGQRSRYAVDCPAVATLPGVGQDWQLLGQIRLGRCLKFTRVASSAGASPVALDEPNRNLALALTGQMLRPSTVELANSAIALDAVDPVALDKALLSMSWNETMALRKEVLPVVGRLREVLIDSVKKVPTVANLDRSLYSKALQDLKADFERARDEVAKKWRELKIGVISKTLGAEAAVILGLSFIPCAPTASLIEKIIGGALLGGAAITKELQALIPAHTKLKSHPIYFFDHLPDHLQNQK